MHKIVLFILQILKNLLEFINLIENEEVTTLQSYLKETIRQWGTTDTYS